MTEIRLRTCEGRPAAADRPPHYHAHGSWRTGDCSYLCV